MIEPTEVLIVGAGPTGLMMACQLLRFNVKFRIIDKNKERASESRAFGIQAKTLELFQNLGLIDEFLKRGKFVDGFNFYARGKKRANFNLKGLHGIDSPYKAIFILPQSETESILIEHLQKHNIGVEREVELVDFKSVESTEGEHVDFMHAGNIKDQKIDFDQSENSAFARIKNNKNGAEENVHCRYLIGCDGAHSLVRKILNIPFVGQEYHQEFVLADVDVEWPFPKDELYLFTDKKGFLVAVPFKGNKGSYRFVLAEIQNEAMFHTKQQKPGLDQIENFVKKITYSDAKLSNPEWMSYFHLHQRAVKKYQKENVFLSGDAAHIHSPAGAQGMNTGLQDVSNLAWKIALVLKYNAPKELLNTYETERQKIGEMLTKTTDRIFGWLIYGNIFSTFLRVYLFPFILRWLTRLQSYKRKFFLFVSELAIHYENGPFVYEFTKNADHDFLMGPKAGYRAPDAPLQNGTLFNLLKDKPFNILFFGDVKSNASNVDVKSSVDLKSNIEKINEFLPEILGLHFFERSEKLITLFKRYGLEKPGGSGVYFIRPDGYIGFRSQGFETTELLIYLKKLFR